MKRQIYDDDDDEQQFFVSNQTPVLNPDGITVLVNDILFFKAQYPKSGPYFHCYRKNKSLMKWENTSTHRLTAGRGFGTELFLKPLHVFKFFHQVTDWKDT